MEVMVEKVCGIDVHQKTIVCCILVGPLESNRPKKIQKTFGTTTLELKQALSWIEEHEVSHVLMESTGQYWRPVFNIFSDSSLKLILANPAHIKNVPGRKTDVKDAEWIAQLGRCGLVQPSYLPCQEAMELRLLTRKRTSYTQKLTHIKNEIHNILQRANIKLTTFLSDVYGKTGQKLLNLFINGEMITMERVAELMDGRIKASPGQLYESLQGKMSKIDRYLLGESLEEYNFYKVKIERIEETIEGYCMREFPEEYAYLIEVPGIKKHSAAVILAEIGPSVEAFKTVGHLTSWAGMSPGSYESAGKSKSSRTTRGNKYLKSVLVQCGGVAGRSGDRAFYSLYNRISAKGSKMKAVVACGHKLLRIIYKILSERVHYNKEKALGLRAQN